MAPLRSVASVSPSATKLIQVVSGRLRRYLDGKPAVLRRALTRGLLQAPSGTRAHRSDVGLPFWLLAPAWYLEGRNDRACLNDILFAQCCLFLTVRLHDDLIDGQTHGSWLILAGDDLLIEAQDQLARHVEDAAYWSLFRRAARKTLHGIAEVDRLQTQPSGMPASSRRLYASVAAILSVGVGAVFARTGRLAEYPMFERLFADLAIASQLLDDLEDVEEDAARGRLNVAATTLIGSRRLASRCRDASVRRTILARKMLLDGRAAAVIDMARGHAQRAARTASVMKFSPGVDYATRMAEQCASVGDAAHRVRVDLLFAGVAGR